MTALAAVLGFIFAMISALFASYTYVERHDVHAQLETLSSRVDSLQGSLGNAKQSMRRDVRKLMAEELEDLQVSEPQQDDGGMNDMMQALMMQQFSGQGGQQQGDGTHGAPPRSDVAIGNGGQNEGDV